MRRPPLIQQLSTASPSRILRWTMMPGCSLRAYQITQPREPSFCVSTFSAELHLVLEGELWLEMGPAHQQLRVEAGHGALVHRGTPHRMQNTPGARFLVVDLDLAALPLGVTPIASGQLSPALTRALPHLWEANTPLVTDELQRQVAALVDRSRGGATLLEPSHSTALMAAVKRHLEQHFAEPIDLTSVAARFGVDRYYLLRSFRRSFGIPPLAYVNFLRLEHFIWAMLREGKQRDLIALSTEAGFGDYSSFCRRVREHLGRPPSQLLTGPP